MPSLGQPRQPKPVGVLLLLSSTSMLSGTSTFFLPSHGLRAGPRAAPWDQPQLEEVRDPAEAGGKPHDFKYPPSLRPSSKSTHGEVAERLWVSGRYRRCCCPWVQEMLLSLGAAAAGLQSSSLCIPRFSSLTHRARVLRLPLSPSLSREHVSLMRGFPSLAFGVSLSIVSVRET